MEKSNLALALSKAQGTMSGAKKDSANPFFKSKYADLTSVWEACREALSKNEIAVFQKTGFVDGMFGVITKLQHSSGEFEEGFFPVAVPVTAKAQEMGSAVTYARRYALAAMVGVAPEDDDGNAAQSSKEGQKQFTRDDADQITGLINAVQTAKTLEALSKIVDHKKTKECMDRWKVQRPQDYDYIITATEEKRRTFEEPENAAV